jgi:hypothetical protein
VVFTCLLLHMWVHQVQLNFAFVVEARIHHSSCTTSSNSECVDPAGCSKGRGSLCVPVHIMRTMGTATVCK